MPDYLNRPPQPNPERVDPNPRTGTRGGVSYKETYVGEGYTASYDGDFDGLWMRSETKTVFIAKDVMRELLKLVPWDIEDLMP